jgi:hypothetical protein
MESFGRYGRADALGRSLLTAATACVLLLVVFSRFAADHGSALET